MEMMTVREPAVLTREDVDALFRLMIEALSGGDDQEDLAFSGKAPALLFDAYREHLLKLMSEWDELSGALRSEEARRRARILRERLKKVAGQKSLVDKRGRPLRAIEEPQTHEARSLILGKGMEI